MDQRKNLPEGLEAQELKAQCQLELREGAPVMGGKPSGLDYVTKLQQEEGLFTMGRHEVVGSKH